MLGQRLAIGGMGEVYLAVQLGLGRFQKPLALKLLLPHLSDSPQAVQMFLDEAQLAARMNHPNVIQIFDVGVAEGRHYIAMELVRGVSMSAFIAALKNSGQRASPAVLAYVGRALCDGLHHAHELVDPDGNRLQVVHRDVTPHNVLLSLEGDVKLTDFGIAKARDSATHTRPGYVKGKFEYIAPEQLLGKPLDRRVDIFGAGLTLYHLATLNSPFRRENEVATLHAIEREPLPALSMLRPDLPRQIREAITKAAHKDPGSRFGTARAFRDALPPAPLEAREELADLVRTLCHDALAKLESKTEAVKAINHAGTSSLDPAGGGGEPQQTPGHATVSLRGGDSNRPGRREPGEGERTPGFTEPIPASEHSEPVPSEPVDRRALPSQRSQPSPVETSSVDYPVRSEPTPAAAASLPAEESAADDPFAAPGPTKMLPPARGLTDESAITIPPSTRARTDESSITAPPPARSRPNEAANTLPPGVRTEEDDDESPTVPQQAEKPRGGSPARAPAATADEDDAPPPTMPVPAEGRGRAAPRAGDEPPPESDDSAPTRPPPPTTGSRAQVARTDTPPGAPARSHTKAETPASRSQAGSMKGDLPSGSTRALNARGDPATGSSLKAVGGAKADPTTGSMKAVGGSRADPATGSMKAVGGSRADPTTGSMKAVSGSRDPQSGSHRALLANPAPQLAPEPLSAPTDVSVVHTPKRLALAAGLVGIAAVGALVAWLLGLGSPSESAAPQGPSLPTRLEPLSRPAGQGTPRPGTSPSNGSQTAGADSSLNAARVGYLDVEATPGASVYVYGKKIGETPITRQPVEEGMVTVLLVNPENGRTVTRKVKVSAGKHAYVKEDLR